MTGPAPEIGTYFTGLSGAYAAHRPSYPGAAIDAVLASLPESPRVADVGCGTGISSRLLAARGARVIGIDPNADMLAAAAEPPPAARGPAGAIAYRRAEAEATGLDDASVDAVLCAQSFHWFDETRALAEFRRILVPDGRLALMWNVRGHDDPVGAGYADVVKRAQADAVGRGRVTRRARSASPDATGAFVVVARHRFANPQRLDRAGLLGRARSASYFPREGALARELEAMLLRLFDEHERDGIVTLEQTTEVTLAIRSGAGEGGA